MGIVIHLEVSKSTTEEEWNKVYQESLVLVNAFRLQKGERLLILENRLCVPYGPESARDLIVAAWNMAGAQKWIMTH